MSPSLELQGVIVARLKSTPAVTAFVKTRVYDAVPPEQKRIDQTGAAWPYITLGEGDETGNDADCIDGFELTFDIDVWSRGVGFPEAKQIADAVRAALKSPELTLQINALAEFQHRQTRIFRDPDGQTSHAVLTYQAFIEQP